MYLFMMLQDQIYQLNLLKKLKNNLKKNNAVVPYLNSENSVKYKIKIK